VSAVMLDLCRSVPFASRAADETGDGRTLEGHAAVFGERTLIDSWEGQFYETIRRGAFRKTIRERTPVMQFDHGKHPLVGSIPIGAIEDLREDDEGLYVRGRLSDNWLIQPVRDAIGEGSITGMSFRFSVVREEWRDRDGRQVRNEDVPELLFNPGDRGPLERTLMELRVPELGPVVFPAYAGTDVGVRARSIATDVFDDELLRREVQRALFAGVGDDEGLPDDPQLRRDVARAVLFGAPQTRSAAPLPQEHPAEPSTTGTPPAGHLPPVSDAPPAVGHPSPTDREGRKRYARLAYVTREGVGRR